MKQPVSRRSYARKNRFLGVMLQEGAPLLDALWNEASEIHWELLRDVIRDAGLSGCAGDTLKVEAVTDVQTNALVNLRLRGGPERFYCDGLPVLWPRDVLIDEQACCCDEGLVERLTEDVKHYVYLYSWVEYVDGRDLPDLDEPFLRDERGSFRPRVGACVRVSDQALAPPPEPNIALTLQSDHVGEHNALYVVELVGSRAPDRVDVLWDDRNASTVTRLTEPAAAFDTELVVADAGGFSPGDIVRVEAEAAPAELYQVDDVADNKLTIRRVRDGSELSLAPLLPIVQWFQVAGALDIRVVFAGDHELQPGALVTDLRAEPPIPRGDHTWRVVERLKAQDGCSAYLLSPHLGLVGALNPWREPTPLRRHARSHDHCVVVDERACWSPGAQIRLSAIVFEDEAPSCCGEPPDAHHPDDTDECPPNNKGQRFEELRTIQAIERCGMRELCGDEAHVVMAVRLDEPLASDHLKCHDFVEVERIIRVRRYAGLALDIPVAPFERCDDHYTGACSLEAGFTLPNGLQLCFTRPPDQPLRIEPGRGWRFAARIGGWHEHLYFAPVDPVARGMTLLATLVVDKDGGHVLEDMRPMPAAVSPHTALGLIQLAAEALMALFPGSKFADKAGEIAYIASLPRIQGPRGPHAPGLFGALAELAGLNPLSPYVSGAANTWHEYLYKLAVNLESAPTVGELDLLKLAKVLDTLTALYAAILSQPKQPEPAPQPKPQPKPQPQPEPQPQPKPEPQPQPQPQPQPEPQPQPQPQPEPQPQPLPLPFPPIPLPFPQPKPEPQPEPLPLPFPPIPLPFPQPKPEPQPPPLPFPPIPLPIPQPQPQPPPLPFPPIPLPQPQPQPPEPVPQPDDIKLAMPPMYAPAAPPSVDLFALPTRALRSVEHLTTRSTRARILRMWPTIGDVLSGKPTQSRHAEAVRRDVEAFVQLLRNIVLARQARTTAEKLAHQVHELWAQRITDEYPPPDIAHLTATLLRSFPGDRP